MFILYCFSLFALYLVGYPRVIYRDNNRLEASAKKIHSLSTSLLIRYLFKRYYRVLKNLRVPMDRDGKMGPARQPG